MVEETMIIRDPIHGDIEVGGVPLSLLKSPEVQRLNNIKQLGFAHLVFPGAQHTRLEHSLGAFCVASRMARHLDIDSEDKRIVCTAALLHDLGHGPFSHTLESILVEKIGIDHVELTEKLILGTYDVMDDEERKVIRHPRVCEILEDYGLDHKEMASIIKGRMYRKAYLSQMLNSSIDVDQLDYLLRDAYYTGVAYGLVDIGRILSTIKVYNDSLTVKRKGVSVVENVLVARGLMYSSVYFHKTVRIAELMLSKALIELEDDDDSLRFFRMTDAELVVELQQMGGYQQEISTRLKYRDLFKNAYTISYFEMTDQQKEKVKELEDVTLRREKELELEDNLDIPHGQVIIDIPRPELLQSEPRINNADIFVVDGDVVQTLDRFTPLAKAIRERIAPDWAMMVITDQKYRKRVKEKAEDILFA